MLGILTAAVTDLEAEAVVASVKMVLKKVQGSLPPAHGPFSCTSCLDAMRAGRHGALMWHPWQVAHKWAGSRRT